MKGARKSTGQEQAECKEERGQPGLKRPKKPVQDAQLDTQPEDVQDELFSNEQEGTEEACQSDVPAAVVQRGETQAETLKRTIFVGNIPQGTISKDLKNLFKRCVPSIIVPRLWCPT